VPAAALAAGLVVDSRTVITRLPPTAYQALRAAFRGRMGAYRPAPPRGNLDTCYDFAGAFFVVPPRVELVLERGNVLELDRSGVLFAVLILPSPVTCLPFGRFTQPWSHGGAHHSHLLSH